MLTVGGLRERLQTGQESGTAQKGLLSLPVNVHFQGPGLNVSEIIGAPRRHSAKQPVQLLFPREDNCC